MMLRLPRRRIWRVAIYLGSLWLVVTAIDLVIVQERREIRPGYETTRIVSPTLPDGRVDYVVAIDEYFGRGVTAENNAAVPALRAWGRWALSPQQPTNGVTDRLGMEPLPAKGDYWVEYDDDKEALKERDEFDGFNIGATTTWPVKVGPRTRKWVAANEGPLRLLMAASRQPRFFIPFYAGHREETMISVLLRHVIPLQETTRALLARAAMRLEAGDAAGFREDVLTVHRWARLLAQTPTLVERLVAIRMETNACRMERMAAAAGKLPAVDAKALAADLAGLGDLPSPSDTVDHGERLFVMDICQWMVHGGPRNVAVLLDQILTQDPRPQPRLWTRVMTTFLPIDYEDSMRQMNMFYDGAVVAWRQPTWALRQDAMQRWEEEGVRAERRNLVSVFLSANWPAIYLLPKLTRAMTASEEARAELRLTQVALGLAAYHAETGTYPTALGKLVPHQLPEAPTDPFTDAPFIYAKTADGYQLYSVGPNMVDDHGSNQKPGDDIPGSLDRHSLTTAPTTR